jgi:hypothetical protein
MYTVRLDMNELPMNFQLQIAKRSLELQHVLWSQWSRQGGLITPLYSREMLPPNLAYQGQFQSQLNPVREPLTMPTPFPPTRPVTAEDIKAFQSDPFEIVGKTFILHSVEDGDEEVLYEVAEIEDRQRPKECGIRFSLKVVLTTLRSMAKR